MLMRRRIHLKTVNSINFLFSSTTQSGNSHPETSFDGLESDHWQQQFDGDEIGPPKIAPIDLNVERVDYWLVSGNDCVLGLSGQLVSLAKLATATTSHRPVYM